MNGELINENDKHFFWKLNTGKYVIEDKAFFGYNEFTKYEDAEHAFNGKTCATCCYHINDTPCEQCVDFSKYEVI